jgi:hypothetical protein
MAAAARRRRRCGNVPDASGEVAQHRDGVVIFLSPRVAAGCTGDHRPAGLAAEAGTDSLRSGDDHGVQLSPGVAGGTRRLLAVKDPTRPTSPTEPGRAGSRQAAGGRRQAAGGRRQADKSH